jgi:hypothetical protein
MVDLALLQSVSYIAGALGVCVAAVYYVMNLRISQRNQELSLKTQELALKSQEQNLETRQAQLFMQIYGMLYNSEFIKAANTAMAMEFTSLDDWIDKYGREKNPEDYTAFNTVIWYFEGIGVLVKRGLVDPTLVDDLISGIILSFWDKFKPWFLAFRVRNNFPQAGEHIEYLYHVVKEVAEKQYPGISEKKITIVSQ